MTENNSNPNTTILKIEPQKEEAANFYIIEELDEQNPLELDHSDYVDYENATHDETNSEEGDKPYRSSQSSMRTILRRTWDYSETKEMLRLFRENKRYIDRLMRVRDGHEFIAKKLNNRNPMVPFTAAAITNKIKALKQTYRTNRCRKHVPKTDIDRDLEAIFGGSARLLKLDDLKSNGFETNETSIEYNSDTDYFKHKDEMTNNSHTTIKNKPTAVAAGSSSITSKPIKILLNSESQTSSINSQTQYTQTDLGDNMLIQLIQIEKNQQKRWEEEKALTARIEHDKAKRFARKELLLQDICNAIKSIKQ